MRTVSVHYGWEVLCSNTGPQTTYTKIFFLSPSKWMQEQYLKFSHKLLHPHTIFYSLFKTSYHLICNLSYWELYWNLSKSNCGRLSNYQLLKADSHQWSQWTQLCHAHCMISGFHCNVVEIYALLGYYVVQSGKPILTICETYWLLVLDFLTLEMGQTGCPKMSVWNYHSILQNIPEQCRSSHILFEPITMFRML